MSDHTRRALLGAATTAVASGLAGCTGGVGFGGSCSSQYALRLDRVGSSGLVDAALSDPSRPREEQWLSVVETANSEGEAMLTTIYGTPIQDGALVQAGEAYYETVVEVTETTEVVAHVLELEYEQGQPAPDDESTVAYESLPAVDRAALDTMLRDARGGRFTDANAVSIGGFEYVYPEDAETESMFLTESPVWVRYEGVDVEVSVDGTTTAERETVRITLREVAETTVEFREYLRETVVVELSPPGEAEREVLRRAAGDEYDECEPLSGEFQWAIDRLREVPDERRPDGSLLAEFDGETYVAQVTHAVV